MNMTVRQQKLTALRQLIDHLDGSVSPSAPADTAPAGQKTRARIVSAVPHLRAVPSAMQRPDNEKAAAQIGFWPDLPREILKTAAVHEIVPDSYGSTSAIGFAARALAEIPGAGKLAWCVQRDLIRDQGRLFLPGLERLGIDTRNLLVIETGKTTDSLWVLEEIARSGTVAAIVGIIDEMSFTQSRRLSLAANHGKSIMYLLRPHHCEGATAAYSRWSVSTLPSAPDRLEASGPGNMRIMAKLLRCRHGAMQRRGLFETHNRQPNTAQPIAGGTWTMEASEHPDYCIAYTLEQHHDTTDPLSVAAKSGLGTPSSRPAAPAAAPSNVA